MKQLLFTVTNDLTYDQRMIRICTSLTTAGFKITLVGIQKKSSIALSSKPYKQVRLAVWFKKGPAFYIEYNCRLLLFLLFTKADLFCCIDLDTILPVWLVSVLKNKKRVYDAHEYFSQQKEIVTRPRIYKIWHWIEKRFTPQFVNGYTVSNSIADEFKRNYKVNYEVIRNVPLLKQSTLFTGKLNKNILYQGAINEGRGLEQLIPAMKLIDGCLLLYGDGNFVKQTKSIIADNNLENKVFLMNKLTPDELNIITSENYIGINLVENIGLNQYYSLANKFFDYIHHLVPQVTMDFPEYKAINEQFEIGLLLQNLEELTIANGINKLLHDDILYKRLRNNCIKAREILNWQEEEKKLILFYKKIFAK